MGQDVETDVAAAMMDLRERIPKDEQDAEKAEKALSKQLEKLSTEERERILFEVHGVAAENQIDGGLETDKLEEVQQHLLLLEEKGAYNRALQLNPAYVRTICVMLLRAEKFDAKHTAIRLALHFEVKRELFVRDTCNDEILVRDVTWADLDEQDQFVVLSGAFQIGSKRDASGRIIFFMTSASIQPNMMRQTVGRAYWYTIMSAALTDCEVEKNGIIVVILNFRDELLPLPLIRGMYHVHRASLITTAAVHYCYQSSLVHVVAVVFRLLAFSQRSTHSFRFRFHYGNLGNIAFELQTFGIPMDICPVQTVLGTGRVGVTVAWHLEWLNVIHQVEQTKRKESDNEQIKSQPMEHTRREEREQIERGQHEKARGEENVGEVKKLSDVAGTDAPTETVCIVPRRADVLFGKSKLARDNPGSLHCRYLVRTHWDDYENASRREKTKVADVIIAAICESGGRFLRPNEDEMSARGSSSWVVVEHEVARAKVSHMFRHVRLEERIKAYNKDKDGNTVSAKKMPLSNPLESEQPRAKQRRTST